MQILCILQRLVDRSGLLELYANLLCCVQTPLSFPSVAGDFHAFAVMPLFMAFSGLTCTCFGKLFSWD